jgi:hypothetical protein
MKTFSKIILSVMTIILMVTCNKDDDIEPVNIPEENMHEVEYTENGVEVPRQDIVESFDINNSDFGNGIYVFQNPSNTLSNIIVGQTVLLVGLDLVKITSIEKNGNTLTLGTEPGSITDLIYDGRIYYRGLVSMDTTSRGDLDNAPVIPLKNSLKVKTSYGDAEVTCEMTRGSQQTTFKGTVKVNANPGVKVNIAYDGYVNEVDLEYEYEVDEGSLVKRRVIFRDISGEMNFTFGGIETGPQDALLKLPITLRIPAPIGFLPTWFGIGATFEFKSTLSSNSSALGTVNVKFGGSTGFEEKPSDLKLLGEGFNVEASIIDHQMMALQTSGFGVLIEFPKLLIGVGYADVLEASLYTSIKNECVVNFVPEWDVAGNFPVIVGNCYEGSINTGFYCGAIGSALGIFELKTEQQLYSNIFDAFKLGDYCD